MTFSYALTMNFAQVEDRLREIRAHIGAVAQRSRPGSDLDEITRGVFELCDIVEQIAKETQRRGTRGDP
jgi:hypothetical protein